MADDDCYFRIEYLFLSSMFYFGEGGMRQMCSNQSTNAELMHRIDMKKYRIVPHTLSSLSELPKHSILALWERRKSTYICRKRSISINHVERSLLNITGTNQTRTKSSLHLS